MPTSCSDSVTDFAQFPELTGANLPAEDRIIFGSCFSSERSTWANSCEEKYRRQISELETYIATVRFLRNKCTPISRLPNEILAHVFEDSSLIFGTHIRRVCRRWRSVLLACPRFWAQGVSACDYPPCSPILLRAALGHSGTLPIAININDGVPESTSTIWDTLLEHHTKLSEVSVDCVETVDGDIPRGLDRLLRFGCLEKLHRIWINSAYHGPYSGFQIPDWAQANLPALRTLDVSSGPLLNLVVASLTTLILGDVTVSLPVLVNVLNRCPLLKSLELGLATLEGEDVNSGEHKICLPRLREVTISDATQAMTKILSLFESQPFSTRTLLTLDCSELCYSGGLLPTINHHRLFAPPHMHRTCIQQSRGSDLTARTFSDSIERLRIELEALSPDVESIIPPIIALIVSSPNGRCDRACIEAMETWALPCLERLEISHMSTASNKRTLATVFLHRFGDRASELSLAWVLPVHHAKQETQSLAEAELQDLLCVLRKHAASTVKPRLGRLELYAVDRAEWEPFNGSIEAGSDARLCSNIVEPFLAELKKCVDVVHVG